MIKYVVIPPKIQNFNFKSYKNLMSFFLQNMFLISTFIKCGMILVSCHKLKPCSLLGTEM